MRSSRRLLTLLAGSALCLSFAVEGASAQSAAPAAAPAAPAATAAPATTAATPAPADPVIATVNGASIHLSELSEMTRNLPQQLQGMSPDQLYPILLDQTGRREGHGDRRQEGGAAE